MISHYKKRGKKEKENKVENENWTNPELAGKYKIIYDVYEKIKWQE